MRSTVRSPKLNRDFYLYARRQKLKGNGKEVVLYFFSGEAARPAKPEEWPVDEIPADREVTFNAKTGLPLLKKKTVPAV